MWINQYFDYKKYNVNVSFNYAFENNICVPY